jgi:glycosyltransferase involved in cell wall biosynthesis
VLFSGGKFELRKGQDLVLKAFQILARKYADLVLVNCWHNLWPASMDLMAASPYIRYERKGDTWEAQMNHLYAINDLDADRIYTVDLVPNGTQRDLYRQTDLGVFPNRCEGGTNLVLMEYMACGKPVVAANGSGQRDIVTADNALLLDDLRDVAIKDDHGRVFARWQDPALDELVAQIEYAYHHRDAIRRLGQQAGQDLKAFTWAHSARQLLAAIGAPAPAGAPA